MKQKYNPQRQQERLNPEYQTIEMDKVWRPIFDKYDWDHDGLIPFDDFKKILKDSQVDDVPHNVLKEIMERSDWDKNNKLSYDEFLHMIHCSELGAAKPRFQSLVYFAVKAVVPSNQRTSTVHQYIDQYTCCPPPIFMILISLIELGVFTYYSLTEDKPVTDSGPVPFKSVLIYNPNCRIELWRFISYMFIHAGYLHITFNVLIQLALGIPLELVHKWWRVGIVYFAGVLAGSLGASISDQHVFLAGASGGVYALIAAHLANVIINYKEMEFAWLRLLVLGIFAGFDVGKAVYDRYVLDTKNSISYAAHIAGSLAGLLVGVVILRNLRVYKWESILGWLMFGLYCALMVGAILYNALRPEGSFDKSYCAI